MVSQFTRYSYLDAGAPAADASIITVLDAVLVNGYGAKAAAGWNLAYTDTNKRVYQSGANSSGCFYRIGEPNAAFYYRMWAAETMLDVNTAASGRFPTEVQRTGGLYAFRAAVGTPTGWVVFADSQTCYFFGWTGSDRYSLFGFGDYLSAVPNAPYRGMVFGDASATVGTHLFWSSSCLISFNPVVNAAGAACFVQRGPDMVASSVQAETLRSVYTTSASASMSKTALIMPNPADNAIYLKPWYLLTYAGTGTQRIIAGTFRGLHQIQNNPTTLNPQGDNTFSGTGLYAGRTFEAFVGGSGANIALADLYPGWAIETSATVESNA